MKTNFLSLAIAALILVPASVFAQSTPDMGKNLSARPIIFDSAYDLRPNASPTLFSKASGIYARVTCNSNPFSSQPAYLSADVDNRFGSHIGRGYMYFKDTGYAGCAELLIELFDAPENFEFVFGPVNAYGNRDLVIKKREMGQ